MDLQTIVDIAQLAGTATVIGGTVFGLMPLKEFRIQRRNAAAGDLMRAFMSAEFANAMAVVMNLPDGISGEELRARGPEAEQKVPAYIQYRRWAARRYDPRHPRVNRQRRRLGDMA